MRKPATLEVKEKAPRFSHFLSLKLTLILCQKVVDNFLHYSLSYKHTSFCRKIVKIHMMYDGTRFLHRVLAEASVIVICRSLISVMTVLVQYQVCRGCDKQFRHTYQGLHCLLTIF